MQKWLINNDIEKKLKVNRIMMNLKEILVF
jgi:hypothetical protein